ncbi:hypothetical protein SAMN06295912_10956 [Sphingomonas laterariae]|uniref:Lipoprotein n=1 Tax=Edaphosphingomonas laterariae TaxID=861865 RepID=A0A239FIG6_9SPHN|nr:hypothetical protein [Sphingomonas laterariae]SNS56597.1 hypothetical protein SAMN06295912_10956 [Sphingomonas laterariae]
MQWMRIAAALAAPMLLAGCLLQPGKFSSGLTVKADRSYSFAYKGEVYALDPSEMMESSLGSIGSDTDEGELTDEQKAEKAAEKAQKAKEKAETEVKRKAVAEALMKETGYRSVVYLGNGKYLIDYEISGKLDHSFVYPFNSDAEIVLPFIAVELRKDGSVRVSAPAFAGSTDQRASAPGMPSRNDVLDGSFTLTTDAEIVMHNEESGVQPGAGGMKTLTWRVTPLTKDAPKASLRLAK